MGKLQEYFSEEHDIFRGSVRKFVEKEVRPHIEEWEDAEIFPIELYKKAADAGFLGLGYPEEYGGVPCDTFMSIAFTEEMIYGSGSIGLVSGLGSFSIAIPPIVNLGTEEQKQKFVVPVIKGEKIAALGITEPNAGSDVANITTRAVRDGDDYIVNGAKTLSRADAGRISLPRQSVRAARALKESACWLLTRQHPASPCQKKSAKWDGTPQTPPS